MGWRVTRLQDRVAVVTGSGRGLGKGMARRLAREGAIIVVADLDETTGPATAAAIESELQGRAVFRRADVGVESEAKALIEWTAEEFGRLDVVINNAQAFGGHIGLEDKTNDAMEKVLRTGLWATFWTMQAAFPHLRDGGGGSIINMVSLAGETGLELISDYAATKEAIRGLSRSAACEWGPFGVRVNCIAPVGLSEAAVAGGERDPQRFIEFTKRIPMRHHGDPEEEIGGAALFFASDDSKFVTGTTLFVDGGLHLTGPPRNTLPIDKG